MTEDEFVRMLAIAVAQGQISEDEAAELLRRFRADELRPIDLPLPADQAVRGADDDAMCGQMIAVVEQGLAGALTVSNRLAQIERASWNLDHGRQRRQREQ